jgi:hypothetical protein
MIFFECYNDEDFLKFLGLTRRDLSGGHSFGRSNVCLKLKNKSNCRGFVDEDPKKPKDSYFSHLLSLKPSFVDDYLMYIVDPRLNNKVIVIRPDLESFALRIARERKIDLEEKYNLSNEFKVLHDTLKIQKNEKERLKFIQFVNDVSDHKAIVKLKELLK